MCAGDEPRARAIFPPAGLVSGERGGGQRERDRKHSADAIERRTEAHGRDASQSR